MGTLVLVSFVVLALGLAVPIKVWKHNEVALGEGRVRAFTLFECKYLFSIIFYTWETIDQVRFHTHAFSSIAILLSGSYEEEVIDRDLGICTRTVNQRWRPRFLPKDYCHSIKRSHPGTRTVVFAGPWKRTWWEFFPSAFDPNFGTWQRYTWGRKKIGRMYGYADMPPRR